MPNVIMIESLWDMTEDTIGVRYRQYADMKQAAVVVGTAVDGGRRSWVAKGSCIADISKYYFV
jgi:hypothetical protein